MTRRSGSLHPTYVEGYNEALDEIRDALRILTRTPDGSGPDIPRPDLGDGCFMTPFLLRADRVEDVLTVLRFAP